MITWLYLWACIYYACLCSEVNNVGERSVFYPDVKVRVPQLDGRIVGGQPVNISSHPHQVTLHWWHSHFCGGSIISADWVLTAAHCTERGIAGYSLRLGTSFWNSGGVLRQAAQIINHPLYNGSNYDYDISLVKLARPQSEVEGSIQYAQLPPEGWQPSVGAAAVVTGWGTPYSGAQNIMSELQEVRVPIVSLQTCQEYYREWSEFWNIWVTERMLCSGFVNGGYDACQGDSGGPLIVNGYLTGVVSWGNGCAWPGYPGVYASVPNLLSWIKENTGL